MSGNYNDQDTLPQKNGLGCLSIFGLIILTIAITIGATLWAINSQWFSKDFKPVALSTTEETELSRKLSAIGDFPASPEEDISKPSTEVNINNSNSNADSGNDMSPKVYTEDNSKRRIELTERELNALLAKETDLAERIVIDLSNNMASVKLLVELDPDLPFFGGKTLKVSSGTEISYSNNRPAVVMKGVSVWGIPIPDAWLGGLKNIDLVSEFGGVDGFWKSFADGIDDIRIEDGKLLIQLAE